MSFGQEFVNNPYPSHKLKADVVSYGSPSKQADLSREEEDHVEIGSLRSQNFQAIDQNVRMY